MKRIEEETVSFCSEFFLVTETVTDISGSQFLKKDYISTNANCFCGWWKTFSFIFLDSSQLLPVKTIFPSNGSYFLVNPSFQLVETCFLFVGKSVFKDEPYSCCGNLFSNILHPASANGFSA